MKIYLSNYWRKNSLVILSLILLIIIGTIIFCLWSNNPEDYIMVLCATWFVLILGCIIIFSKRFLTYVILKNHKVRAYSFFKKKLCTIDITNELYYAIFETPQGVLSKKRFIALSNEPFLYHQTYGITKVRFIQHYNMKKLIILPFDEQTIPLLNLEKWHKVN